jgi:hypothetical protein
VRKPSLSLAVTLSTYLAFAAPAIAQHDHGSIEPASLGTVDFPTSCSPAVQPDFNRAVALLHSFWYKRAIETFSAIAKSDPSCGMAQWGVAMSHYRQLWDPPTPSDLQEAWAAVQAATATAVKTQRERDYIAAAEAFYKDYEHRSHVVRALAYEDAMRHLYESYPKDREAAIFYALAVRANAPAADKSYASQLRASAILEKLFAEYPDHPGLAHYIIHCDDYPPLASHALVAARRYAKIAPDAPHALHMPSHIFTRLGLWQESIDSNLASAAAARRNGLPGDELHARDYLVYAYLQRGEDREALNFSSDLPKTQPDDAAYYAGLYATATIPARMAVERHRWADAAALALPVGVFPGGRYAWAEANLYFARALGSARLHDTTTARSVLQQLTALRDTLSQNHDNYSAEQVDVQREVVTAWIHFAEHNDQEALSEMRAAAAHDDATEKSPVTPGTLAPARELLGEMLLESKQPALALEAFETSLITAPNRFNSLCGAARAAELAGDRRKSVTYYQQLVANAGPSSSERPEIQEARQFLVEK